MKSLIGKEPINFSLPDPTKMRYLDPSFYAHNHRVEHILKHELPKGYYPFPQLVDQRVVEEWKNLFKEDTSSLTV